MTSYQSQQKKRQQFSDTLSKAGDGGLKGVLDLKTIAQSYADEPTQSKIANMRIAFSEHKTENDQSQVLEMMSAKRQPTEQEGASAQSQQPNIVIYFGGRDGSYSEHYKDLIAKFASLPDCDEIWYANSRKLSLSANTNSASPTDLINDAEHQLDYIKKQYKNPNITIIGMCAGSPAACELAAKHQLKFFSDRSFISISSILSSQVSYYANKLYILNLILVILLTPVLWLLDLWLILRGYELNQGKTFSSTDKRLRDSLAIIPPKKDHNTNPDSLTKGTAGLLKYHKIQEEDLDFDYHFKSVVEKLLSSNHPPLKTKKGVWPFKSKNKAGKTALLQQLYQKAQDPQHSSLHKHAQTLEMILSFHKGRKAYSPADGDYSKRDPHTLFPHCLNMRHAASDPAQYDTNPYSRANLLVKADTKMLLEPLNLPGSNEHIQELCKHVKPLALTLQQEIGALDSSLAGTPPYTAPVSTPNARKTRKRLSLFGRRRKWRFHEQVRKRGPYTRRDLWANTTVGRPHRVKHHPSAPTDSVNHRGPGK